MNLGRRSARWPSRCTCRLRETTVVPPNALREAPAFWSSKPPAASRFTVEGAFPRRQRRASGRSERRSGYEDDALGDGLAGRRRRRLAGVPLPPAPSSRNVGLLQSTARQDGELVGDPDADRRPVRVGDGAVEGRRYTYALSEYAYTHAVGGETVLECPLIDGQDHAARREGRRRGSCTLATAEARRGPFRTGPRPVGRGRRDGVDAPARRRDAPKMRPRTGPTLSEGSFSPALATWEFHDLLFHARTREGRHDYPDQVRPIGMVGKTDPPPALKGPVERVWVRTRSPRPGPTPARRPAVRRGPGVPPVGPRLRPRAGHRRPSSASSCSASASAKERPTPTPSRRPTANVTMDFAPRPYPGGGALYELELYLTVNAM